MTRVKATPVKSGRADCPRCGQRDVETRWVGGVERFQPHSFPGDGTVKCLKGSNKPVPG